MDSAGENIAFGYRNAHDVCENGWRKSTQGHYESMINANYGKIGVGFVIAGSNYYWVQLFTN